MAVTAPLGVAIAVWLAAGHCRRRALYWCLLFGATLLTVIASKVAFLGWGVGIEAVHFAGFSGHAARAAAVFPVAAYLALCGRPKLWRYVAVSVGVLLALGVSLARVMVDTHSVSEAILGAMLGLACAAAFIALVRSNRQFQPSPVLIALSVALLCIPYKGDAHSSQQWMTGLALGLSGADRVYTTATWGPTRNPYSPPCPKDERYFNYVCF
ncbi:phosphatase PAP2 family protein [Massilia sp. CCM 8693]|uniref:Phosphatase PAP2 family protein n=1 Tax=Massilia aquatica TaxID=2609000 RepID=A0ABX0MEV5_9BURK|nr:phosphatase PAP2 family protein [Massilia aquatica]